MIDHISILLFCFPAENLKAALSSKNCSPLSGSSDSDTDSVFPVSPNPQAQRPSDSEALPGSPGPSESSWPEAFLLNPQNSSNSSDIDIKVENTLTIPVTLRHE